MADYGGGGNLGQLIWHPLLQNAVPLFYASTFDILTDNFIGPLSLVLNGLSYFILWIGFSSWAGAEG